MRIASLPAGLLAALLIAASASAQLAPRKIPSGALRGTYTAAEFPGAFINGTLVKMAPGVRIVMPDNRSVPPAQVPPGTPIRYELDARGQVRMVWVLTAEEARKR
jgi:hypothetical protein